MPKCERCQLNDARVRLDSVVNGRREQHFFCRQCAEELLGADMSSLGGSGGFGGPMGGMFGAEPNAGGTATAQRTNEKQSKTPTLDEFGRDLTQEARDGKLDPSAGRGREVKRVLPGLGRRRKKNPQSSGWRGGAN